MYLSVPSRWTNEVHDLLRELGISCHFHWSDRQYNGNDCKDVNVIAFKRLWSLSSRLSAPIHAKTLGNRQLWWMNLLDVSKEAVFGVAANGPLVCASKI
jgi:hypothetical protein